MRLLQEIGLEQKPSRGLDFLPPNPSSGLARRYPGAFFHFTLMGENGKTYGGLHEIRNEAERTRAFLIARARQKGSPKEYEIVFLKDGDRYHPANRRGCLIHHINDFDLIGDSSDLF